MTRRLVTVSIVVAVAACSAPAVGERIARAPAPEVMPTVVTAPPAAALGSARDLGAAPDDLREVDWSRATIPGEFCDLDGDVTLDGGPTAASSGTWGPVEVTWFDVAYGDLVGDTRPEAALRVYCSNRGGTAAGLLQYAIVLLTSESASLRTLGTIVPRRQPAGQLPTLMSIAAWRPGALVVTETWYRPSDPTCCPSGVAEVTWTVDGDTLVPGPVRVTG